MPRRPRLEFCAVYGTGYGMSGGRKKDMVIRDPGPDAPPRQRLDYMALAAYRDSHASTRRCEIPGHMIDAYLEEWTSMERREPGPEDPPSLPQML